MDGDVISLTKEERRGKAMVTLELWASRVGLPFREGPGVAFIWHGWGPRVSSYSP